MQVTERHGQGCIVLCGVSVQLLVTREGLPHRAWQARRERHSNMKSCMVEGQRLQRLPGSAYRDGVSSAGLYWRSGACLQRPLWLAH